jgi:hypothetical protein
MKSRDELPTLFSKTTPIRVAEVGVLSGGSHVWLVDAWLADGFHLQHDLAEAYILTMQKYAMNPNVHIIHAPSPGAAALFEDDFFNWIYIDANHRYDRIVADIEAWLPKCKDVISGHDYVLPEHDSKTPYPFGIRRAVKEFFGDNYCVTKEKVYKSWYVSKHKTMLL